MVTPLISPRRTRPIRRFSPRRELLRRRRQALLVLVVIGVLVALFLFGTLLAAMMALFGPTASDDGNPETVPCEPTTGDAGARSGDTGNTVVRSSQLDEEQLSNARTIVETGKLLKVPEYGWVVAIATAMQESTLRNIDYGDRDSIGLFQQRDAWGTRIDRLNPKTSSTMFYTGGRAGQAGLMDIPGWEQLPVTEAAQKVQRSAYPDAYADDEPLARELVAQFGGVEVGGDCGEGQPLACPETPWPATESGLTPDATLVLRCTHQQWPQFETFYGVGQRPAGGDGDHAGGRAIDMMIPYGDYTSAEARTFGWKVANWLRSNHTRFGIKYLIYDNKIWSVRRNREGWRPYRHYQGCGSDTCLHRDHIHASVYGDAAALPTTGDWTLPVNEGWYELTARFGDCGGNWSSCHTGLDFAAATGAPVLAANGGRVIEAKRSGGPYGNYIKIDHGQGIVTMYAHLYAFAPRIQGARVSPGMMIGEVGSTGNSTGPHLHFEVRRAGTPVDPEAWLKAHGVNP